MKYKYQSVTEELSGQKVSTLVHSKVKKMPPKENQLPRIKNGVETHGCTCL